MASRNNLFFFFIIISFFFFHSTMQTQDFNLDFASFSSFRNLTLLGDSYLRNGVIGLTKELGVPSSSAGSVICTSPVPFFDSQINISASFSTRFSFSIKNMGNPSSYGDGLVFFVSPNNYTLGSSSGYLGLVSSSSSQHTNNKFFAIEFDTRLDPLFSDPNDNHIGLDTNNVISIKTADVTSRGIDLKSGNSITAWIDYDNHFKILKVWVSYSSFKPENPVLSADIDLSLHVQDFMFLGFSASTEGSTEVHLIQDRRFQTSGFQLKPRRSTHPHNVPDNSATSLIPVIPIPSSGSKLSLGLGIACPAFFCLAIAVFSWFSIRKNRNSTKLLNSPPKFQHSETYDFPHDLLPLLFSKLPVTSLARFKLVSKSVLLMIKNPDFINELPFCWEVAVDGSNRAYILTIQPDGSNPQISNWMEFGCLLQCTKHCRGLIVFKNDDNKLFVCNLSTGEWRHVRSVSEPSLQEYYEFGYDNLTNKYKLLMWREHEATGDHITDIHVCTLEEVGSWRRIRETPGFVGLSNTVSLNVNGTIFWLDVGRSLLISFDFANEAFRTINLPAGGELNFVDFRYSILEVEGDLALVKMPKERGRFEIVNLWLLRDVFSHRWTSILGSTIIPLEGINLKDYSMSEAAKFVARNGEMLIVVSDKDDLCVVIYNFLSCQFKQIRTRLTGLCPASVTNHLKSNVSIKEWGEAPPSNWW